MEERNIGDLLLYGNKIGVVTNTTPLTLALNDGTTMVVFGEVTVVCEASTILEQFVKGLLCM